jgi:hypothetical protein
MTLDGEEAAWGQVEQDFRTQWCCKEVGAWPHIGALSVHVTLMTDFLGLNTVLRTGYNMFARGFLWDLVPNGCHFLVPI